MSSPPPRPSATADDKLIAAIGADRALSLHHAPAKHRPALVAIWRVDAAMGDVVARSTEPALGRIKLAWWREALDRLDAQPAPAEPRLRAVESELLPRGIAGAEMATIEAGWATLLDASVDADLVADRGATLFRIAARVLGGEDGHLSDAGALWALASVARRGLPELFDAARPYVEALRGHRFPVALRTLTLLTRLAVRDLKRGLPPEPEGSAGRAAAALAHRWSGFISR